MIVGDITLTVVSRAHLAELKRAAVAHEDALRESGLKQSSPDTLVRNRAYGKSYETGKEFRRLIAELPVEIDQ